MSVNELYFGRGNTKHTQWSDESQKLKRQYSCKISRHSLIETLNPTTLACKPTDTQFCESLFI